MQISHSCCKGSKFKVLLPHLHRFIMDSVENVTERYSWFPEDEFATQEVIISFAEIQHLDEAKERVENKLASLTVQSHSKKR